MTGQENIIKKISDDAAAVVDEIRSETRAKTDAMYAEAEKKCAEMRAEADAMIASRTAEIQRSRETVADLDIKKQLLGMRRELIDEVFDGVAGSLRKILGRKYPELISAMLRSAAEDGDVLVISANDADVITDEFVKKTAKAMGIKLSLDPSFGDFAGGIVLRSSGYDKNLTIEVETETLREEMETKVAELLFAGL